MDKRRILLIVGIIILVAVGVVLFRGSKPETPFRSSIKEDSYVLEEGKNKFQGQKIENAGSYNFGVKIYPGSSVEEKESLPSQNNFNGQRVDYASFRSSDSVEKIVTFYKSALGSDVQVNSFSQNNIKYTLLHSKSLGVAILVRIGDSATIFSVLKVY